MGVPKRRLTGVNLLFQGQSVFHNTQELEEFAGAITEVSERDGDFLAAAQTEKIDGGIAKYG
jgi:hypothetical protein